MSKRILITGANGQLGNEMRRVGATSENIYIYTDVAELDITNIDAIRAIKFDICVNCAAYTNVDKSEDDYGTAELINATAAKHLATVSKEQGATLIHISTDYVFDGSAQIPYTEDQSTDPIGAYGKTKLHGEQEIDKSGCNAIIIRTAWLYSEFGGNFVKTMQRLTAEQDTLKVVFDQVGTPTYAGDLAKAIFEIIENDKYSNNEGVYHFSNEGVCSWYDFAIAIAELSGNICDIQPCHSDEFPSKVKRPHFSVLDKTKIKSTFDISIPYWRDSLKVCIEKIN